MINSLKFGHQIRFNWIVWINCRFSLNQNWCLWNAVQTIYSNVDNEIEMNRHEMLDAQCTWFHANDKGISVSLIILCALQWRRENAFHSELSGLVDSRTYTQTHANCHVMYDNCIVVPRMSCCLPFNENASPKWLWIFTSITFIGSLHEFLRCICFQSISLVLCQV